MAKSTSADATLNALSDTLRSRFEASRRILSYSDYIEQVLEHPQCHARNSAQYVKDAFDHFGDYEIETPRGTVRRFGLFDGLEGSADYLIGQEEAQNAVYRCLDNFAREGRNNRLILLHGPNGAAKSSLISCMVRALELYSETDEGCLYKFNWVFPTEKISRSNIGFGGDGTTSKLPTYAFLEDVEVSARLTDELGDPPLFLLPGSERRELLDSALAAVSGAGQDVFVLSQYLARGDLSHKNKQIFESLLAAYHGDFTAVLKHVQVERFYISRRYRVGTATVGPEMRVDAAMRQITSDTSLASLPSSLKSLSLFETFGDLVDGNRGLVEFNDLLKRPMDLNRYLLATSETGTVSLETLTLHLDTVLMGTVNEGFLDALKGQPDWASYKGRMELVRMPYLVDYRAEKKIYEVQLERLQIDKPVAPHVCEFAALWAVLTRLNRPQPDRYPEPIREVLEQMEPLEKAMLFAKGEVPDGLSAEKGRELLGIISDLFDEGAGSSDYEGRHGASPREIKSILLNAAHSGEHPCLSPTALLAELEKLVEDSSIYEFLQIEPDGAYHRPKEFIEVVTEVYLDRIDDEFRSAMGLIEEGQYEKLFGKYVENVSHSVRKEKILNPASGQYEPADERFMKEVEEKLGVEGEHDDYRQRIISSIGAFRVENPDAPVDYRRIFPRQFEVLEATFFGERREAIQKIKLNLLRYFDDELGGLGRAETEQIKRTVENLESRYGYDEHTAREAIALLTKRRYDG
jgi:predicted Ser/Thr protein kinase